MNSWMGLHASLVFQNLARQKREMLEEKGNGEPWTLF